MCKKMKKKGGFALCLHGQRAGTLVIFPEIFIWHKKPNKIFFGCTVVKLLNKLREPVKGY
jgi:hypothetical protein